MTTETAQQPVNWSPGGQICFIDSKAFSVNEQLRTICIGSRREIEKCIAEGASTGWPAIDRLLENDRRIGQENRGAEAPRRAKVKKNKR